MDMVLPWNLTAHARQGNHYNEDFDFEKRPFVLYTIRDSIRHRATQIFCLSERGPRYCPVGSPVVEVPWWEIVGKGDSVAKEVNSKGEIVEVVKTGEAQTRSGRLAVRIPGDHVLKFYDRSKMGKIIKDMQPLFFN